MGLNGGRLNPPAAESAVAHRKLFSKMPVKNSCSLMRFGYENDCAAVVDYSEVTVRGFDGLTVPHLERWCMGGSGDFRDLAAPPSISTKVEDTYEQHLNYAKDVICRNYFDSSKQSQT